MVCPPSRRSCLPLSPLVSHCLPLSPIDCLPTCVPVLDGVSAFPRVFLVSPCLPLSPLVSPCLPLSPMCLCWMVCPPSRGSCLPLSSLVPLYSFLNSMGKGPKFKTLDFRRLSASTTGHRVAWESARWDLLLDMQSAILLDKHDLRIRSSTMNWQKPLHMRLWQEWSWEAGLQRDEPNFELFTALPSCDLALFWIRSPMVICTSGTGIWYAILVLKYELRNWSSTANEQKTRALEF